jgi:alcohol dehydrogenase class IV
MLAGLAFGNAGTTLGHALSYPLSNMGVPHSQAVGLMISYAMEFNGVCKTEIGEYVPKEFVRELIERADIRIRLDGDVQEMAKAVMKDDRHLGNNPVKVKESDIIRIYERCREEFADA